MSVATDPGVTFDPLSAEFAQDPHKIYEAMRATGRPIYYEPEGTWMLTRFADVEAIALNKTMLRAPEDHRRPEEIRAYKVKLNMHDMPHHERFVQISMLDSEGETHSRLRKVVFREFTPALIEKQRPAIQAFVDRLLEGLADRESIDFVSDFAAQVPGHIIGRVLGVPDEDCPQLRVWSETIVKYWDIGRTAERKQATENATKEFYDYLTSLLAKRAAAPQEDLLTRLQDYKNAGQISEDELISLCMLILKAGHGSTIDVLGSGMHALLKFPDQMQRLRTDPSLMKTAIQEMFRYESPLPYFHRFATEDVEVSGQSFESGTRFGLLYGAANRDPEKFENPGQFDVGRTPNRHIAFGGGVHFCLGNHLARLDMDVIFSTLLGRFRSIELLEEPTYKRGLSVRGPEALQIALKAA